MTDAELRDAAWRELEQTTVGWNKVKNYPPPTLAKTHWGKGKYLLDQIGQTGPPPDPPPGMGGSLPTRIPESTGPVVVVRTVSELNAAVGSAAPGTRVQCRAGAYAGVSLTRTATVAAPVTVEPYPGEQVRFVGAGGSTLRISGKYLRVRGIELTDPAGPGAAIVYFSGGSDCEVDRCNIHGNGTATEVQGAFFASSTARHQLWNCSIHDLGVLDNNDHGCYVEGTGHAIISCLIYGMTKGWGIQIYPVASNCLVANCTVVDTLYQGGGAGFIVGGTDVHDNLVVNTIVAYHPDFAVKGYSNGSNNVFRDCLFWAPDTVYPGGGVIVAPSVRNVDPQFANRAQHDYHPGPNCDFGDPAYCPSRDFSGVARTQVTVGCYA